MAYTLNTSHALYPNLVELIGVQSGALVSHKTARTFTKHSEASYQTSGTYGEAFRTVGGGFTVKGASFTPAVSIDTKANPNATIVIIVNQAAAAGGGGQRPLVSSQTTAAGAFTVGMTSDGLPTALENWTSLKSTGTTDLDTAATPHMLAAVKIGETAHKLYVDGNFEVDSATRLAYNTNTGAFWNYIGGATGQGSCAEDVVWIAWFNKDLSEAELDDLYSSLGSNNTFGLVSAPGSTISCGIGSASADGFTSTVLAPLLISCAIGSVASIGYQASVSVGSNVSISASIGSASAVGFSATVISTGSGTLITEPLKNNTGTLLSSQTGATAFVYNVTTGVLIVAKTGQTTDSLGVMTIIDPLIVPATEYRVVIVLSSSAEGMDKITAS